MDMENTLPAGSQNILCPCCVFEAVFLDDESDTVFDAVFSENDEEIDADFSDVVYADRATYRGVYRVTPGETEQVLPMHDLVAIRDVIVEAVPSNYGRIAWNGSSLTVF